MEVVGSPKSRERGLGWDGWWQSPRRVEGMWKYVEVCGSMWKYVEVCGSIWNKRVSQRWRDAPGGAPRRSNGRV